MHLNVFKNVNDIKVGDTLVFDDDTHLVVSKYVSGAAIWFGLVWAHNRNLHRGHRRPQGFIVMEFMELSLCIDEFSCSANTFAMRDVWSLICRHHKSKQVDVSDVGTQTMISRMLDIAYESTELITQEDKFIFSMENF